MNRTDQILKLSVELFIKTATPVGSQALLDEYHLPFSSATIRAEMNALEKDGFLDKTHTSSGRVPSAKGYSYYVEHLRQDSVDDKMKFAVQKILGEKSKSIEEVIKESCEILSNMTNLVSVVLGPKVSDEHLLSVQIIPLSEKTATAVFITDQGYVENKTFLLQDNIKMEELTKTIKLLNDRLSGTSVADLVPKMEAMRPALQDYVVGHDAVYQAIIAAFVKFASERIKLYGKENLFEAPEFTEDAKKLQKVLTLVDSPDALRDFLASGQKTGEDGLTAAIGDPKNGLSDVSVVSAKINLPGGQGTSIALVGPTRMDYDRAVALLDYVSKALDQYFNPEGGCEPCQKTKKTKTPKAEPRPDKKQPRKNPKK